MKLLDFAVKDTSNRVDLYVEPTTRECGVEIRITTGCDTGPDADVAVIGTVTSAPGSFKSAAFAVDGFLRRGNFCSQPDDLEWFAKGFATKLEYVLTMAMVIEHSDGSDTWTNGTGVQSVALAGATTAQRIAGIMLARDQWEKTIVSEHGPALHIPPTWAPDLKAAGLLNDMNTTIMGDPVIIGSGYERHPNAFWTGGITIRLGELNKESVPRARTNDLTNAMDQWARLDFAPCALVRVGAYA